MLTRAALGANSNCTIRIPLRSYCVRSEPATNASASSSVRSLGNFFFIVSDLLAMHVTGADWADKEHAAACSECKRGQHVTSFSSRPDCLETFLRPGMRGIGKNSQWPFKRRLDIGDGDAMPLAFLAIAVVPIEA